MPEIYAKLVINQKITINDVPVIYLAEVKQILAEYYREPIVDPTLTYDYIKLTDTTTKEVYLLSIDNGGLFYEEQKEDE